MLPGPQVCCTRKYTQKSSPKHRDRLDASLKLVKWSQAEVRNGTITEHVLEDPHKVVMLIMQCEWCFLSEQNGTFGNPADAGRREGRRMWMKVMKERNVWCLSRRTLNRWQWGSNAVTPYYEKSKSHHYFQCGEIKSLESHTTHMGSTRWKKEEGRGSSWRKDSRLAYITKVCPTRQKNVTTTAPTPNKKRGILRRFLPSSLRVTLCSVFSLSYPLV